MLSHKLRATSYRWEPRTISYIGTTTSDVDTVSNKYTFTDVSLGTPSYTRQVIVGVIGNNFSNSRTINGVTVAGKVANEVITRDGFNTNLAIYRINDFVNSTGTVEVTFSGLTNRGAIVIWTLTGLQNDNERVTGTNDSSFDLSLSINLNTTGISKGVGVAIGAVNATGRTVSISGLTERMEQSLDASISIMAASGSNLNESVSVNSTWSGVLTASKLIGAKFY